ncbi:MAG: class B sortase [Lachnospiraceae bacterium]|nr:class B sortase [Lachnospiraceae bacterium]
MSSIKQNWKKYALIVVLIFMAIVGGILLHRRHEANYLKQLNEKMIYHPPTTEEEPSEPEMAVDFTYLASENPDINSWITIPDTKISYPILQSGEDKKEDYYLHHNVDGSYGYPGVIYMQKDNSAEYSDRVTVLYGHNMRDGSMFAGLHKYADSKYFEKHPDIDVYTPSGTKHYKVFAALQYDDRHILDAYGYFKTTEAVQAFYEECGSLADNITYLGHLDEDTKLLVLSTCEKESDKRYLVVAALEAE